MSQLVQIFETPIPVINIYYVWVNPRSWEQGARQSFNEWTFKPSHSDPFRPGWKLAGTFYTEAGDSDELAQLKANAIRRTYELHEVRSLRWKSLQRDIFWGRSTLIVLWVGMVSGFLSVLCGGSLLNFAAWTIWDLVLIGWSSKLLRRAQRSMAQFLKVTQKVSMPEEKPLT